MKNTENIIFEGYPKKMLCWNNNEMDAKEYIVVCELNPSCNKYKFVAVDPLTIGFASFKNAKDIPQSKSRTIEDGLEEGDIIIGSNGNERMVLGKCGKVYFTSNEYSFKVASTYHYTLLELIEYGYKLKPEASSNNTVEMTVAEVSKLVGKNVKIIE
jgi:hypothetical protein